MSVTVKPIEVSARCEIEELARLLNISVRTIQRKLAAGTFPIPTLDSTCHRPQWSGAVVCRYLNGEDVRTDARRFRRVG